MVKSRNKKNVGKNLNSGMIIAWIVAFAVIIVAVLFVINSYMTPVYSPEDSAKFVNYNDFEKVSNELISGQLGLVELKDVLWKTINS